MVTCLQNIEEKTTRLRELDRVVMTLERLRGPTGKEGCALSLLMVRAAGLMLGCAQLCCGDGKEGEADIVARARV